LRGASRHFSHPALPLIHFLALPCDVMVRLRVNTSFISG
jgi:hypothetical protein